MEASALPGSVGLARPRLGLGAPLLRLRSDEQLVGLFRAGNDEAFRVIHDRYRQRLHAYTRQMLSGSASDAEDAVQEVFVRAYNGLRSNDRELALRAWLYRIAHNRCIDEIRRPAPIATEAIEDLSTAPAQDLQARIEQRDALRRLIADVRRLPEQQRSALLMRELGGMPYADVAEALDVSVPAVKSLLVRARVGLAQAGEARDTSCSLIREDLIVSHDRGVRASGLARRHLRDCPECRRFRSEVRGVSRQFAALLPALGPIAAVAKLLGVGSAGGGGAAAGTSAVATSGAAAGGTGAAAGAVAVGAGHVVTLIAAAVVTAGGAIELQRISPPPPRHAQHHHVGRPAPVRTASAAAGRADHRCLHGLGGRRIDDHRCGAPTGAAGNHAPEPDEGDRHGAGPRRFAGRRARHGRARPPFPPHLRADRPRQHSGGRRADHHRDDDDDDHHHADGHDDRPDDNRHDHEHRPDDRHLDHRHVHDLRTRRQRDNPGPGDRDLAGGRDVEHRHDRRPEFEHRPAHPPGWSDAPDADVEDEPRSLGGQRGPGLHRGLDAALDGQGVPVVAPLTEPGLETLDHEELVVRRGARSGLYTVVAVHCTIRGPSLGGCRMWSYDDTGAAVRDALRLSRAMTLKAAAADLPLGGGKGVIMAPPHGILPAGRRRSALLDFADTVESLAGRYITAEDVGTSSRDMSVIARETTHVAGLARARGGSGDPSPLTALGVEVAVRATCERALGSPELRGRSLAVIGLGHVGSRVAKRCARAGAVLTVADVDPRKRALAAELGATWTSPRRRCGPRSRCSSPARWADSSTT